MIARALFNLARRLDNHKDRKFCLMIDEFYVQMGLWK